MLRNEIDVNFQPINNAPPVRWRISHGLTPYNEALLFMENEVVNIINGKADELVWLLEHPPLYTAGTSAKEQDLIDPDRFEVYDTNRGGEYTYHGPGQRIAYVMLDLKRRRQDVRAFVSALEAWIIGMLAEMNIKGERREDRVGVWIDRSTKPVLFGEKIRTDKNLREDKIAAIGIRLKKWVSFHGISINVEPNLDHFSGIIPCGIPGRISGNVDQYGVTSLVDLGLPVTMENADIYLRKIFEHIFGPTISD